MAKIKIFTDGGARGNPGPAALGVYIQLDSGEVLARIGKTLGETTNNVAEYSAILEGLNWLGENKNKYKIDRVDFFMDSQLAYAQLVGVYKVKNSRLREFLFEIRQKEAELNIEIYYSHVRREQNKDADLLVNLALDNKIGNN